MPTGPTMRTARLAIPLDHQPTNGSSPVAPELRYVSLDAIDEDRNHVRHARLNSDITALAESIRANGLLHPLLVQAKPPGDRYRLLAGHRRLAAMHRLRVDTVPVLQLDPRSELHCLSIQIVENVRRRALTPTDRRNAFLRLRELAEGNTVRAASLLGIHPASFRRVVRETEETAGRSVSRLSIGQTLRSLDRWAQAAERLPADKQEALLDKALGLVRTLQLALGRETITI